MTQVTRDRLKQAGLWLLGLYLVIGPGLALWGIYVQDANFGEGASPWIFWWALPGLAALPVVIALAVRPTESRIHPRLFRGLVVGASALGALFAGWALWVSYVLAPEHGDDVYRWWIGGLILMVGALFVILGILFFSSKEGDPEAGREGFSKRSALDLAGGGLVFAGFVLLLWAFYVDDADTSEPEYIYALLLFLAGFARWAIPWVVPNWKRVLVGAFMFMYTAIVLALAVDAIDGSEDWRFWTLIGVWMGALWALLREAQLRVVKIAIEVMLVICVFSAGIAILIFIVLRVFGNEVGSMEDVLWAPLSFMVEVALPAAGMVGGLEIAEKLRCWLGVGRAPRCQLRL